MCRLATSVAAVSLALVGALGCTDAAAATGRKTDEPVVARVLHLTGSMQVKPFAGPPFPAAEGGELVKSDRLVPADESFAFVGLDNGYVVRIDDTGSLAVGSIIMLKAPPTTTPVAEQLASLIDLPQGFDTTAVTEKAAAWRQMPRAAESSSREEARKAAEGDARQLEEDEAGAKKDAKVKRPTPPAPAPAAAPPPDAHVADDEAEADHALGGKSGNAGRTRETSPRPPPSASKTAPSAARVHFGPSVDAALAQRFEYNREPFGSGARARHLASCRDKVVSTLGVTRNQVSFRIHVQKGVITRVSLGGALPTPPCAAAMVNKPVTAPDGWYVVTLL
jgi:hypothetical protein